jgi:O-antigen/teichoic acid export membrane protein
VIFPLLALLVALAPVLIPFVFGRNWTPAVVPAQILAVAGMVAAVLTGYPQVMLAVGRPRELLQFNVVVLVTYGTAVALAASHGLVVVSVAVVSVYLLILLGAYRFLLGPQLGITVASLLPGLGPAVGGSAALLAVAIPLRVVAEPRLSPVFTIALVGLAGLAVYAVVLRIAFRSTWDDLRRLAERVIPTLGDRRAQTKSATVPA